jgi:hypothetical protein
MTTIQDGPWKLSDTYKIKIFKIQPTKFTETYVLHSDGTALLAD